MVGSRTYSLETSVSVQVIVQPTEYRAPTVFSISRMKRGDPGVCVCVYVCARVWLGVILFGYVPDVYGQESG